MGLTLTESARELGRWMFLGPLYAAGIAFGLVLILSAPLMIELLFDPNHVSEDMGHLFDTLYIWIGVGVMAGGYGFFLAVAPATFTGLTKVVIDRVVEKPRHRERWIYGLAVPLSTVAWFYYLMVFPSDFSFAGTIWGKPAYSWMIVFIGMGLVCSWLIMRYKATR